MATPFTAAVSPTDLADESVRRKAYGAAWHLLRDVHDANDVVQTALLRALKFLHHFDPEAPGTLAGWVARIARRVAFDMLQSRLRSEHRRLKFPHADEQEKYLLSIIDRRGVAPINRLCRSEEDAKLAEAMALLPERQRGVLESHYFEERHLSEIGADDGLTKNTMSSLHVRALKRLRFEMENGDRKCAGCGTKLQSDPNARHYSNRPYCGRTCRYRIAMRKARAKKRAAG